jgi:hypothetical protein
MICLPSRHRVQMTNVVPAVRVAMPAQVIVRPVTVEVAPAARLV